MWTDERANIREYLWSWDRACREYGGALLLYYVNDRALARHALEGVLAFGPKGDDPTEVKLRITKHPRHYLTDGAVAAALRLIERPDQIRSLEISLDGENPSLQYLSFPRFPALERLALWALPIASLTGLSAATRLAELDISHCDELDRIPGLDRALELRTLRIVQSNLERLLSNAPPNLENVELEARPAGSRMHRNVVPEPPTPDRTVNLSRQRALRRVVLRGPFESADLSGCPSLVDVDVRACPRLARLDLTGARLERFRPRFVARPAARLRFREVMSVPFGGAEVFAPFSRLEELDLEGMTSLVDTDGIEHLVALRTLKPVVPPKPPREVKLPTREEAIATLLDALIAGHPLAVRAIDDVDGAIAEIDARVSRQLDEILHHPKVRALEDMWRALHAVVRALDREENARVEMLNASLDDLILDFEECGERFTPGLYKLVFSAELGGWTGEPYGAVIATYDVDLGERQVDALRRCARIAHHAHAVFATSLAPRAIDAPGFEDALARIRVWEWARHLALTVGRMRWREPWTAEDGYAERVDNGTLDGPAVAAVALRYLVCARWRWAARIEGYLPELPVRRPASGPKREEAARLAALGVLPVRQTKGGPKFGGFESPLDLSATFAVTRALAALRVTQRTHTQIPPEELASVLRERLDLYVGNNPSMLRSASVRFVGVEAGRTRFKFEVSLAWRDGPRANVVATVDFEP